MLCLVLAFGVMLLLARDYAQRNSFRTLDEKKALVIPYVRLLVAGELRSQQRSVQVIPRILSGVRESIAGSGLRVLLVDPGSMVVIEDTSPLSNAEGERFVLDDDEADRLTNELADGQVRATAVLPGGGGRYHYIAQRIRMDSPARGLFAPIVTSPLGRLLRMAGSLDTAPIAPLIVVLAQPVPQIGALLVEARDYILPAILVALGISFAAAYLLGGQIARPVARLAHAARAIGRGDYSQQVAVEGNDELATLTRQFNEMASEVGLAHQIQRDFVANVSHDLKTPLTSIQGFSQALLDGATQTPADYRQAASIINEEARRMDRMVTELLSLASLQNGLSSMEMKPVLLAPMLSQLLLSMQPQANDAGVQLSSQFTTPDVVVLGDMDRLRQAFANLVENALKYTPSGGTVTLRLEEVSGGVSVQVEDTGRGIPEAEVRRVTERFYQVDKSRSSREARSLGLGLAIAQDIIHAHGAQFSISSVQTVGTTVRVFMPSESGDRAQHRNGTRPRLQSAHGRASANGTVPEERADVPGGTDLSTNPETAGTTGGIFPVSRS